MTEKNGDQAQVRARVHRKHQQEKPSDDPRQNQRQQNQPAEKRFARKAGTIERESCKQAERERKRNAARRDDQAIQHRGPDGAVGKKLAVPVKREMAWWKTADAVPIEGINDEHNDR